MRITLWHVITTKGVQTLCIGQKYYFGIEFTKNSQHEIQLQLVHGVRGYSQAQTHEKDFNLGRDNDYPE